MEPGKLVKFLLVVQCGLVIMLVVVLAFELFRLEGPIRLMTPSLFLEKFQKNDEPDAIDGYPEPRMIIVEYSDADSGRYIATCSAYATSLEAAEEWSCLGHEGKMSIWDIFDLNEGHYLSLEFLDELPQ